MQTYLQYLESPEWWRQASAARKRARHRCERCGSLGPLHVHHSSYNHLGAEHSTDLEVLCEACHRAEHAIRNREKRTYEAHGQARLFDRWNVPPFDSAA
jgi:5-methylcytosine-specific restriction endonuclease McrA